MMNEFEFDAMDNNVEVDATYEPVFEGDVVDSEQGNVAEKLITLGIGFAAGWATTKVVPLVKKGYEWASDKVKAHKEKKALRKPEEGKVVEPTEAQVVEATTK
jgi:hypothetical protein